MWLLCSESLNKGYLRSRPVYDASELKRNVSVAESDGGLRSLFRKNIKAHWQSLETYRVEPGTPDSNYCLHGGFEGFIENKKTHGWAVKFQPGQIGWAMTRSRYGGLVVVAVRRLAKGGPRSVAADELWLIRGAAAGRLARDGLRGLLSPELACSPPSGADVLGRWNGGDRRWDWDAVAAVLRGEWVRWP